MKQIDIALQGGGSHGAFTWGVLDRLLELDDLEIAGISGTSAGAMNAVALAQGLSEGGPERARELLRTYWERVAEMAKTSPFKRNWWDQLSGNWSLETTPGFMMSQFVQQVASPYQFNPLNINPLEDLVRECFDFEKINAGDGPKVFLSATNVRTGRPKIFRQPDISVEAVMASACLPQLYKAVEIDGEAYWDGGYVGNPPLFPLVDETDVRDIVIVQINPLERPDIPKTPYEIMNRLNEITFNASLTKELRSLGFLWELINHEKLERSAYRDARLHRIEAQDEMCALSVSSKMNAEKDFLDYLFRIGRDTAENWIENAYPKVGSKSSWLPREIFEESLKPAHMSNGSERDPQK
ncbi:patatin-like phospholipase family protein [Tateyamaria pelophila]|uniref:patatin-like phospholipase family protein n=1 Tax=Tateyamaria pelophila TaxID=328415 RepID=UPI001CBAEE65|nr:patatin-like phospholipase family protein [Tateyamaria pelophila]